MLVAGPIAREMVASFEAFWCIARRAVAALHDVPPHIGLSADEREPMPAPRLTRAEQILDLSAQADNPALIERRLVRLAFDVGRVDYVADLPNKGFEKNSQAERDLSTRLQALLRSADDRILLQTPYLVLSRNAQKLFREMQGAEKPPRIKVL